MEQNQYHNRHTIRLKNYDYSKAGLYFITICTQNRDCMFGEIIDGKMELSRIGTMAEKSWLEIPQHFPQVVLHDFVIMPNHVHGIIEITTDTVVVGAKNFSPENDTEHSPENNTEHSPENNTEYLPENDTEHLPENDTEHSYAGAKNFSPLRGTARTVGSIVRGFKIGVTKQIGFSPWQRNYYEHIIRNRESYENIANYIKNNPLNWKNDCFY